MYYTSNLLTPIHILLFKKSCKHAFSNKSLLPQGQSFVLQSVKRKTTKQGG